MERTLARFLQGVEEMSGGQIEIELFAGGALVPVGEQVEATSQGVIDMSYSLEGWYAGKVPVSDIASGLPFVFRSNEEARYFMYQRGFLELLREAYEQFNIHTIPCDCYDRNFITKDPVYTVDDIDGMKIRGFGAPADLLAKFGASLTNIPPGETYTALSTGVVDGAIAGAVSTAYDLKWHEVTSYLILPELGRGSTISILVNMDVWNEMTPQQQAILEGAAAAYQGVWMSDDHYAFGKIRLEIMRQETGFSVITLPDEEVDKLQAAAVEILDGYAQKDAFSAEAVSMVKDYLIELGYIE